MNPPYVQDARTGKSGTRAYVAQFLEAYISPAPTADGRVTRSVYDTVFGYVGVPKDTLYLNKPKNPVKRYVGRAAAVSDSRNPNETLWCVLADISIACQRLPALNRQVVVLKFIYDYGDDTLAQILGVKLSEVNGLVIESIDMIAKSLDD